jgi:serine/threonine protein kinase
VAEDDTLRLVGRTIADKYAVESVVAEGGFATVYRAMHLIWKRPVALKVFRALSAVSSKDRQRLLDEFIQEGALLADLSARSAAIVQARDIGMLDVPGGEQIPYMVLEWLEGETLEAILSDEAARGVPPRKVGDAVHLLDSVAEALALAHRKGIAHRDVKPGNVFVLGDPRGDFSVKLLDFGIAKVVSDAQKMAGTFTKTSGQVTSFTPAYGAPEQFSRTHGATGPWTDVFSLALIVVETLTGQEPLQGADFVQLAVASASADRRPTPRTLGATVSDEVEAVFVKALAVKPTERWQSAGDFWNGLRRALQMSDARDDRSVTASGRTDRRTDRHGAHDRSRVVLLERGRGRRGSPVEHYHLASSGRRQAGTLWRTRCRCHRVHHRRRARHRIARFDRGSSSPREFQHCGPGRADCVDACPRPAVARVPGRDAADPRR